MVDFAEKLKDVELAPWMLSIYKDDEHHTLFNRALECYKSRLKANPSDFLNNKNPFNYVQFPPVDKFKEYINRNNSAIYIDFKHLRCVESMTHVIDKTIEQFVNYPSSADPIEMYLHQNLQRYLKLTSHIKESWMWDYIKHGYDYFILPEHFPELFTEEQALAITIMA